jgi:hypothetical protein
VRGPSRMGWAHLGGQSSRARETPRFFISANLGSPYSKVEGPDTRHALRHSRRRSNPQGGKGLFRPLEGDRTPLAARWQRGHTEVKSSAAGCPTSWAACARPRRRVVRTCVRDFPGLGLLALPPCARSRHRHGGALGRIRTPARWPSRSPRALPPAARQGPKRYPRAALRWHGRLRREVDVSLEEAQAILAALVVMAGERKGNAAYALAELLSSSRSAQRRGR